MFSQSQNDGVIGILPFGSKLPTDVNSLPLASLEWPLARPHNYSTGTVGDLSNRDQIVITPQKWMWLRRTSPKEAKLSLALPEPRGYHGKHYRLAKFFHHRFHRVVTADSALVGSIPNGVMLPFGTTWVPEWESLDTTKKQNLSLIASKKRFLPGHKLRHQSVEFIRSEGISADIMGRGYKPFSMKSDGLAQYRFSVVIENCREENYFTEKLVDALLCKTVPIYWGCPNVGDFFDTAGMILCETLDELKEAIRSARPHLYEQKRDSIQRNIKPAIYYGDYYARMANALLKNG